MKILFALAIMIFVAAVFFSACSWTTGGENIAFPEKNVQYMHHVKPFLALNCSYSPCHSDFDRAGGYSLTEYWTLFDKPGFVIPGNPDGSVFVQILENRMTHFTYFYRGNITTEHIQGVRTWIKEGAINN